MQCLHVQCIQCVHSCRHRSVYMSKLNESARVNSCFGHSFSGKHFKVLFAYKAAFRGELNLREGEIIIGKERDRNGWMLGTKLKAKEEGWFPAVYVDQVCVMFYVTVKTIFPFSRKPTVMMFVHT